MNDTVDASLLIFGASIAICWGALLLINRNKASQMNAAMIRDLGSIYGRGLTERAAKSSTSKNLTIYSISLIAFGIGLAIGSFFPARASIGDGSTGMAFAVAGLEVVGAAVLVVWIILARSRGEQWSPTSMKRAVRSAIVMGVVGLTTAAFLLVSVSV